MGLAKLLVIVAVISLSLTWWQRHETRGSADPGPSPNGFVAVAMPDRAKANTVIILAPVNCPSVEARRADALAEQLDRLGIPHVRSSSYSTAIDNPTADQVAAMNRAVEVLNGDVPAVFVNGMAKANPSAADVVSEYERTR